MRIHRSALILGLAASGEAAARLLLAEGTKVRILDENDNPDIRRRADALKRLGAEVDIGAKKLPEPSFDVCILSPGIKPGSPVLKAVQARGIPVLPEFELGWSRARCPVLAVTGSNGKSTLVKLCAETLQLAGRKAVAAGNYGPPVSQVVLEQPQAEWLVVEVSSFQLETVENFHPRVGVLLNIYPNHLDRHRDLKTYAGIKARLFAKMTEKDVAVINENNLTKGNFKRVGRGVSAEPSAASATKRPLAQQGAGESAAHPAPFAQKLRRAREGSPYLSETTLSGLLPGSVHPVAFGLSKTADYCFCDNVVKAGVSGRTIHFSGTYFANEVLGITAAAAAAAMEACGIPPDFLESAARGFIPLPHRMETIGTRNDVRFIDDSKATNVAALIGALKMLAGRARLIAGGLPKNESYAPVLPLLAQKVAGAYLIGKAAAGMAAAWQGAIPCQCCETIEKAVAAAWRDARPGETILLSPACASFDQFRSFKERGEKFRKIVELLEK